MFIFENLEAYKKAIALAKKIFSANKSIKDRTIKDQLCRAVLSVPLNIAEGQGRYHQKEKRQFYCTAKGSLYESLPLVQLCFELQYFDAAQYEEIYGLMNEVGRVLSGLIRSVKGEE